MSQKKFRVITKRFDIISLIEENKTFDEGIVWQPTSSKRTVFPLTRISIDRVKETLTIKSVSDFDFDIDQPAYVSLVHKGLIFKIPQQTYSIYKDKLVCSFPTEARAHDLRENPRTTLLAEDNFNINLAYAGLLANSPTKFRIVDYSSGGIGLVAPESSKEFFIKNMNIGIRAIRSAIFNEPVMARISYVSPKDLKKAEIRVGLTFKEKISDEALNSYFQTGPRN